MNAEDLLENLIQHGVLKEVGGDDLEIAPEFEASIREHKREIRLSGLSTDGDIVAEKIADNPALSAVYAAIGSHIDLEGYDENDRVQLLTSVAYIDGTSTPTAGGPDAFTPVRGDHLSALLGLYERAIIYVWREECDPCDAMRGTFDHIFSEGADDLALFAVYGPEWAETLNDEFDVVGAPTTLFVLHGTVDARLLGAHERAKVAAEIQKLRELSA